MRFPSPYDLKAPQGAEDWKRLYPYYLVFQDNLKPKEESKFWFCDSQHWPTPFKPFDAVTVEFAVKCLGQYNTRHYLIPPANGVDYTAFSLTNTTNPLPGLNIWNRKTSEKTYDGAGTLLAQTTFEYDNYRGVIAPSGAVQHGIPANSYGTPASSYGSDFTTRGNVTAVNRWRNTDGAWLATTYQYDDSGNVVSATDPMQHTTSFGFADSWGDTSCVTPSGAATAAYKTLVTNALGHQARSKYNSCTGTIASATDPNNQVTTFGYDLMDRKILTNAPDGGQTSNCFSDTVGASCYNSTLPIQVVNSSKITAISSKTSTALLDGLGRVTQTQLDASHRGPGVIKERVRLIGGELTIDSSPGHGARLEITIPDESHG